MLTLNKVKNGRAVAVIHDGKYDGLTVSYIDSTEDNLDGKEGVYSNFSKLELKDSGQFGIAVDPNTERQIIYMSGCSGCGKSYYSKQYIEQYKKTFKDRPVYIISSLTSDKTLDSIKGLQRIRVDDSLITDPLSCEDFRDSLILIDDIEMISEKALRGALQSFKDKVLQVGRHFNISALITSHNPTNRAESKVVLLESHVIVVYLASGGNYNNLLTNYIGLDMKQIQKLKAMKSRWVSFVRGYPQIIFTQKSIFFMHEL